MSVMVGSQMEILMVTIAGGIEVVVCHRKNSRWLWLLNEFKFHQC